MTGFVTEYSGYRHSQNPGGALRTPPINAQQGSSASGSSTLALSSATTLIGVSADAACWLFIGSSGSTGLASSTTGSIRLQANQPEAVYSVTPYSRLVVSSA